MGTLVLNGATSGSTTIQPTDAATVTATFPGATGTVMVSGNMPSFSYWANSATTLSSNTPTKILFDTKEFDTNNNFSSSRFTPTVAGYYQISAGVGVASTYTNISTFIYKNGSAYKTGSQPTSGAVSSISSLVYLNGSTDYVEIYCNMLVGQNCSTGLQNTYVNGCLVRAA